MPSPPGALPKNPLHFSLYHRRVLLLHLMLPTRIPGGSPPGHQVPPPRAHRCSIIFYSPPTAFTPSASYSPRDASGPLTQLSEPWADSPSPGLPGQASSHRSFSADVKESVPRALIVFVGGKLVTACQLLVTPGEGCGWPRCSQGQGTPTPLLPRGGL